MATTISTTYFDALAESGDSDVAKIGYFKIAEGGWTSASGSPQPRTPSPSLEDVDAIENPSRYPVDSRYVFTKAIPAANVSRSATGTMQIICDVSADEANDDGNGNDPEFWEIMVFTEDDRPVAYRTFNKQTKTELRVLRHIFNIVFQATA